MKKIIEEAADFEVARVTTEGGRDEVHIQVTLQMPWVQYEAAQAGARSAGVSIREYVTECAQDGIVRGYR